MVCEKIDEVSMEQYKSRRDGAAGGENSDFAAEPHKQRPRKAFVYAKYKIYSELLDKTLSAERFPNFANLSARSIPSTKNPHGNIVVILALVITCLFAVAALSIETTLFLLKRQELQLLAESIARAAALSLPHRKLAKEMALNWYDALREQDGRELLPDRLVTPDAIDVTFADNLASTNAAQPYKVSTISAKLATNYKPRVLPVMKVSKDIIKIVGTANAGLSPTDIVFVIDNSASFNCGAKLTVEAFTKYWGQDIGARYFAQCFSDHLMAYKSAIIALYDQLSQIETFRIAVVLTNSKANKPLVLSGLDENIIDISQLEYDKDQPDFHSTRCALATASKEYATPLNPNAPTKTWVPPQYISNQFGGTKPKANATNSIGSKLLIRDALWMLEAGSSTSSGFIHPKYFYSHLLPSIKLAASMLNNSTRSDGLTTKHRHILVFSDEAGDIPTDWQDRTPGADNLDIKRELLSEIKQESICKYWSRLKYPNINLGITYFSHHDNPLLLDNNYQTTINTLRKECIDMAKDDTSNLSFREILLSEKQEAHDYEVSTIIGSLGLALKHAENR